ncbi:MAG: hypothetical protein ABI355_00540 [Solirubrobacteraceae bacterium]
MFHLELRQFPHVARVFNLPREELDARFVRPWASGTTIRHEDQTYGPDKGHLRVFEGPEIRREEMGLGRGWANVGRTSEEVTETVLAEAERGTETRAAVETFKAMLRGAARTPMTFAEVMALASAEHPGRRASACLAMAEQAVWESLHQGRLALATADGTVAPEGWEAIVLRWETWTEAGHDPPVLRAAEHTS